MEKKSLFLVIDWTDWSGKWTQTEILVDKLRQEWYNVELADFPQYGKKSAGMVEKYLNWKYWTAEEVWPYRASMFYAADRYDASFKIKKWLWSSDKRHATWDKDLIFCNYLLSSGFYNKLKAYHWT